jgi:hypothetical protein
MVKLDDYMSGLPQLWWTLRTVEFDLDHAESQIHRTIQDQAASSTDAATYNIVRMCRLLAA